MEQPVKVLIYIHAFFGGIGLISGIVSIFVKKGGIIHRRSGTIFSYSMIISALISLVIARTPNHENLFLFLIGVYTVYLVLAGNRALTFKDKMKIKADMTDKSISGIMLITSIIMLGIGVIQIIRQLQDGWLFVFFGAFGLFMTLKDFQTFKVFKEKRDEWLVSHIGRMVAALIASITAFIVAGLNIKTFAAWISPTIIGTIYIIFWNRRIKTKFFSNSNTKNAKQY